MTDKLLDNFIAAVGPTIDYLSQRWGDESEYEEFDEYRDALRLEAAKYGFKLLNLTEKFSGSFESEVTKDVILFKLTRDSINFGLQKGGSDAR